MDNRITLKKEWEELDRMRAGQAGAILSVKKSMSSAEYLALKDSPMLIITAPGDGKVIQVLSGVLYMRYKSVAYTHGRDVLLYYEDTQGAIATYRAMTFDGNGFILTQDSVSLAIPRAVVTNSTGAGNVVNKGLYLGMASAEATGDSDFVLYVTYRILTL